MSEFTRESMAPGQARKMLENLDIRAREESESPTWTMEAARNEAARIRDTDGVAMVVGWSINDHDGCKEPGFASLYAVTSGFITLDPTELFEEPKP